MTDLERAKTLRSIVAEIEALQPQCARRLLRIKELQEAIARAYSRADVVLLRDSLAHRLVDRMRREKTLWWSANGVYATAADCNNIETVVTVLSEAVKELDPESVTAVEVGEDLVRDVQAQKNLMLAVATGGPRINEVNQEFQERLRRIREALAARGIEDPNPYDDLWQWYGKWSSGDLPSYQSRRNYIGELFAPLFAALKQGEQSEPAVVFTEPTGWAKIDRNLGTARTKLASAQAEIDYQEVGLVCRETLIDLAQEVFDPTKHPSTDGTNIGKTDAKRMLDSYLSVELAGGSNAEARKHAKASLDLANGLTHKRTAIFRDAALCAEATAAVVNIVAIISGVRDPK